MFSFQIAFFAFGSLTPLLLLIASWWYPPLSHLTALQACQGVIGECLETRSCPAIFQFSTCSGSFSTVSVWPSLNHAAVRRIQKAEALFFLVGCSILTIIDIQLS